MHEKGERKMPKGKGTYGSKVGRPTEDETMGGGLNDKMGNVGDRDWFDSPEKGGGAYEHGGEVMPSSDSRSRSAKEYAGGGNVGFDSISRPMGYNKGGGVSKTFSAHAGAEWEDVDGGSARILRFNNDNKASGINPEIGEAAKKVGKFVKKAAKSAGDAIQKGINKRRKKKIEKTFTKQDKRIAKHAEQEILIAADDKAREKKKADKKKKKEEEKKKKGNT